MGSLHGRGTPFMHSLIRNLRSQTVLTMKEVYDTEDINTNGDDDDDDDDDDTFSIRTIQRPTLRRTASLTP